MSSGSSTVTLDAHAAANLRYIRSSMQAATTVPVPGAAALTMGVIGLTAAAIVATDAMQGSWLPVWLTAAVVAAVAGSLIMARQYALRDLPLLAAPLRKLLLCLLPGFFAGAVLTVADFTYGNLHAIPGSWLLLYGCALIAASAPTAASVGWLGTAFVALGIGALILPDAVQNLLLGTGFGALHVLFGIFIFERRHGRAG
jgi:hypothetical protein